MPLCARRKRHKKWGARLKGGRVEGKWGWGGGGEDKLLLHHVFIRYDLGSRSGEAEDVAGEEPRIP